MGALIFSKEKDGKRIMVFRRDQLYYVRILQDGELIGDGWTLTKLGAKRKIRQIIETHERELEE